MKINGRRRMTLAMTCLLFAAGLTAGTSNAETIEGAASAQTVIDVDVLLALVAEVKNLRIELLEHRLESYDQRIALLDQGLEKLVSERSAIDDMYAEMSEEVDEVEFQLQDADLDGGERNYLEAAREELEGKRTRTIDHATAALDTEEHDLKARHRDLKTTRNLIGNIMARLASEPGLLRECAQAADRAGIDDLWVVDHIAIPPDDSEGSGGRYLKFPILVRS